MYAHYNNFSFNEKINLFPLEDGTNQWKKPVIISDVTVNDGWTELAADYIIEGNLL